MPCFYCLEPKTSISICLDCRSKLERAKADAERYRKEAERWRRDYWRLQNERKSEIKRRTKGGT